MKTAIATAIGLSLLAGLAGPADAGPRAKKYKSQVGQDSRASTNKRIDYRDTYYEHLADKLPFGSSIWWEQMMRERRGGRPG
jgi:hypothetical protein